jgi:hypothetical protein
MLLVLYMEYLGRCVASGRFALAPLSYKPWLDSLTSYAEDTGATFGEMVREEIDPTWVGD